MSEINLLTTEEKLEQKIQNITKILNILFILALVIIGSIGYYLNTLVPPLMEEKNSLNSKFSFLKEEIGQLSNEEIILRDTKARYDVAQKFRDEKILYEKIIREIYERNISGNVDIINIKVDSDKDFVSVRVSADSSSFKRFVDNLKAPQVTEKNIKDIFSNSGIPEEVNEVSKEYVVTVKYNKGILNAK